MPRGCNWCLSYTYTYIITDVIYKKWNNKQTEVWDRRIVSTRSARAEVWETDHFKNWGDPRIPEMTGEPENAAERLGNPAAKANAWPSFGNVTAWDSTFFKSSKTTLLSLFTKIIKEHIHWNKKHKL